MTQPTFVENRLLWNADPEALTPGETVQLRIGRCPRDGHRHFPVRDSCPVCGREVVSEPLSTEGTLVGYTAVFHQPPDAVIEVPYCVGTARFAEGIEIVGLLTADDVRNVYDGQAIRTVCHEYTSDRFTYAFETI